MMEQPKAWKLPQGTLYYQMRQNGCDIVVTGIGGLISELVIPARIEGHPVTHIAKKAFLSRKQLRRVVLPQTIEEIEDWSFAYCSGLEQVDLPQKKITFGKSVFMECGSLKHLGTHSVSELLAAAVTTLDAYYLLDPFYAGTEEWLAKWDARLVTYLHTDDHDGYSKQVLCGEEDYGSTDLEAFLRGKRKGKVRMCFLRLLNDTGLSTELREELTTYLLQVQETWEVVHLEHGEERRYYEMFAAIGCLTEENFEQIMGDIGEEYPEMKAYFLRFKEEQIGYEDFFEGLSLDL